MGSMCNGIRKTEILDMVSLQWSDGPDFPFHRLDRTRISAICLLNHLSSYISRYQTTHTTDAVYILGVGTYLRGVAKFQNNNWIELYKLYQMRFFGGAITIGNKAMIIGGSSNSK